MKTAPPWRVLSSSMQKSVTHLETASCLSILNKCDILFLEYLTERYPGIMTQKQQFIASHTPRNRTHHSISSRLLYSLLIGGAVALVLVLLEALILWLLNPGHLPGSGANRLLALMTLPSIAIVFIELLLCLLVAYLVARPFALFAYLRAVHAAQAE